MLFSRICENLDLLVVGHVCFSRGMLTNNCDPTRQLLPARVDARTRRRRGRGSSVRRETRDVHSRLRKMCTMEKSSLSALFCLLLFSTRNRILEALTSHCAVPLCSDEVQRHLDIQLACVSVHF